MGVIIFTTIIINIVVFITTTTTTSGIFGTAFIEFTRVCGERTSRSRLRRTKVQFMLHDLVTSKRILNSSHLWCGNFHGV